MPGRVVFYANRYPTEIKHGRPRVPGSCLRHTRRATASPRPITLHGREGLDGLLSEARHDGLPPTGCDRLLLQEYQLVTSRLLADCPLVTPRREHSRHWSCTTTLSTPVFTRHACAGRNGPPRPFRDMPVELDGLRGHPRERHTERCRNSQRVLLRCYEVRDWYNRATHGRCATAPRLAWGACGGL